MSSSTTACRRSTTPSPSRSRRVGQQAVQVGVEVEVTDIEDLEAALELEAPADVTAVLENLLAGSQRHLAAFQRNGGTVTNT